MLREMFNREPQSSRPRRPDHQPVRAFRKELVRQRFAERLVVDSKIIDADTRLRHTGAASGFEDVYRAIRISLWHPSANRSSAQPFILKKPEPRQIVVRFDFNARIPIELFRVVEPERASGLGVEVPLDDLASPRIKRFASRYHSRL